MCSRPKLGRSMLISTQIAHDNSPRPQTCSIMSRYIFSTRTRMYAGSIWFLRVCVGLRGLRRGVCPWRKSGSSYSACAATASWCKVEAHTGNTMPLSDLRSGQPFDHRTEKPLSLTQHTCSKNKSHTLNQFPEKLAYSLEYLGPSLTSAN